MLSANDFKKKQVIFLMTNIGDKLSFSNDNVIVKKERLSFNQPVIDCLCCVLLEIYL